METPTIRTAPATNDADAFGKRCNNASHSEQMHSSQNIFVGMTLILIFAEVLALYGLIVGIIVSSSASQSRAD
ncbi:hypothetical protein L1987_38255 [Smallanthus sonchifolius]|uniref:Uncharacterized protein n=1 Tax=Smallanthus sonchifolius TaxID=185202 RepID=A0ACB9HIG4_9ASTR|nr:hypothetical protein L1987_38255 [Smallanthus sonchifolius]